MRSTMNISLPPALRQWVEQQVETRGFGTASEFVRDILRREREKSLRGRVDQALLEAMQTPVRELNDQDWTEIRRQGQKLAARRKKE